MEDSWMNSIASSTVCGWFYFLFVWQSIMAAFAILGVFGVAFMGGKMGFSKAMRLSQMAVLLVSAGIAVASALFMYILCERAIVENQPEA
jgi:hypothetical protein